MRNPDILIRTLDPPPANLKSLRVDPPPASMINKADFPMQDYEMSEPVPNSNMPFIEWAPSCALSQQDSFSGTYGWA
ncbi:unnamed protein product [Heligmosomoides polygyrus]|uniref:Ovule protein n=1 Tax=Heligmosomoides polygyrus TaxID=6339 RepID=A0A183GLD2_HELPZ|nr:unnamed protein product [Heligmosomoides polygyrus]